jgi:catechol 2,3-dioxygenase-like lactoylglutathione lyase family enzyme
MVHLSHIHMPVPDLARSLAFYRDQLGLDVGYTSESMAEFPTAGLILDEVAGFKRFDVAVTVGIGVDDVDSVFADLEARGVPVAEPPTDQPWGVRNFYVTDPDGYVVEFEQPKTPLP